MLPNLVRNLVPTLMILGCADSTAPSIVQLEMARIRWASHHLTNYSYEYTHTGFFIGGSGIPVRIVVRADTVRSAVVIATGDTIPTPDGALYTINGLFDWAIRARAAGTLSEVVFDPAVGYPRRMVISGIPDASGSAIASHLQPLP